MGIREDWVAERSKVLQKGPTAFLLGCAEDQNVVISDLDSAKDLAKRVAKAEWRRRVPESKLSSIADQVKAAGFYVAPEESDRVFDGDDFESMESGPMNETFYHQLRLDHPPVTESAHDILSTILPNVIGHFLKDNADYGDNHREGLGARAEFVGIHRKVKKLEKALWNGENMNGEGVEEMLSDLIGQCLITLDLLAQENQ